MELFSSSSFLLVFNQKPLLMALTLYWYDLVCFGIVAGAIAGSLWTIMQKEGSRIQDDDRTEYESLLIVAGGGGPRLAELSRGLGHVGSAQLWMSCWRGLHPGWLLGLRVLSFISLVGLFSWDMFIYGSSIMLYYTEWTFVLVTVYFMIATVISAHGCWLYSKRQVTDGEEANSSLKLNKNNDTIRLQRQHELEVNEKSAGSLGYVMQIVYQTSAGGVILTDVVFWGLIVPLLSIDHFNLSTLMCCMHSFNAVFLLLDTVLNNLPFPWFRIAYLVLWSCIYVIFQWVLHACGFTWWPYPFLELSTPWAPVWYVGMALVHIPCYGFYWLTVRAKNKFFSKFFPRAYVRIRSY